VLRACDAAFERRLTRRSVPRMPMRVRRAATSATRLAFAVQPSFPTVLPRLQPGDNRYQRRAGEAGGVESAARVVRDRRNARRVYALAMRHACCHALPLTLDAISGGAVARSSRAGRGKVFGEGGVVVLPRRYDNDIAGSVASITSPRVIHEAQCTSHASAPMLRPGARRYSKARRPPPYIRSK